MAIADLINDWRAKDRAKLIAQGYAQGYALGYDLGYARGYADARSGRPRRMEAAHSGQSAPDARPPFRPRRQSLRRRRTLRRCR